MRAPTTLIVALTASLAGGCGTDDEAISPVFTLAGPRDASGWSEHGRDARHSGQAPVKAQRLLRVLASADVDPFAARERTDAAGHLDVHYAAPILDGDDVFLELKGGTYAPCSGAGATTPCGRSAWNEERWGVRRLTWESGRLVEKWRFESDWLPPPDGGALRGWEPVFHPAVAGSFVLVPGAGASVFALRREDGSVAMRIDPFPGRDPATFVAGPLTVADDGSVVYDALALAIPRGPAAWTDASPWTDDIGGAWLVQIAPDGSPSKVSFADLVPQAPVASDLCTGQFSPADLPWPPAPDAEAPAVECGAQRPGLNVAPAVAPDGTIYTVSRAHRAGGEAYLVAVGPGLVPKWAASLRGRLDDGCGSKLLPPDGALGGCRLGAHPGVDPLTNQRPAGSVSDLSTASPVVAPDGSVLYGASTRYNGARGHLMRFSSAGDFVGSYDFGWDVTPAIARRAGGGFSIVLKENRYGAGSYCDDEAFCPAPAGGPFWITALDEDLAPRWSAANDDMTAAHPAGFEWCVNAPALDAEGTVFSNAEDGTLYAIRDGAIAERLPLGEASGASYTPPGIDGEGRVYAQVLGRLYVAGE